METFKSFIASLNTINEDNFTDIALALFRFQVEHNSVYRAYVNALNINPNGVETVDQIPFLPITFFKHHAIKTGQWQPVETFVSSGTTSYATSQHQVWDMEFYLSHAQRIFEKRFGSLSQYHILALLPSYLERKGSSLIAMMNHFIQATGSTESGFYLRDYPQLLQKAEQLKSSPRKTIIWGVSFALLELAEQGPHDLRHCMIFETGGMKGRRKELIREEFHQILNDRLKTSPIYSEYGMTELMSQAYSLGNGYFQPSAQMKIVIRDINDPFSKGKIGQTGGINVVDLANFHSCAFIETQDLGRVTETGEFEVLGRFDNSDLRGCNLLV